MACYVVNDLSYNILSVFPHEIECISSNLLEVLNSNMSKIDSVNDQNTFLVTLTSTFI